MSTGNQRRILFCKIWANLNKLVSIFLKCFTRFNWEPAHWSLWRCLIQIWNCSQKEFFDFTVFHKQTLHVLWTHGLVYAVWCLCKFWFYLIQRGIVNYISSHKNVLNECIFDVALSITLLRGNFVLSGITSTWEKIFTCQDFF